MNFLAHLYLSKDNPEQMVGNFIGDHVKGASYKKYPPEIAAGIIFHREIDHFTDNHEITKASTALLKPIYERYAGVVTDMIYDYYLASSFDRYSTSNLNAFESNCYKNLFEHYSYLPDRVKNFLPKMQAARRLQSYAHMDGIYESLDIMSKYTSLPNKTIYLKNVFPNLHQTFEKQFHTFFPKLIDASEDLSKRAEIRVQK